MTTFLRRFAFALTLATLTAARADAQEPVRCDSEKACVAVLVAAAAEADRLRVVEANPSHINEALARALVGEGNRRQQSRDPMGALAAYGSALTVSSHLNWPEGIARATTGLGLVNGQLGEYDAALDYLTRSAKISEGRNDQDLMSAYANIGIVHRLRGDHDLALQFYERTLELATAAGREDTIARAFNNIGLVHWQQGRFRDAISDYEQSLRLKEKAGPSADLANTLNNLGGLYDEMGNDDLALVYYRRSHEMHLQLKNGPSASAALANIGHVYAEQGRYAEALPIFRQAAAAQEAAGDRVNLAVAWMNIGRVLREQGQLQASADAHQRAVDLREALGAKDPLAVSLSDLAETTLALGRLDEAAAIAARAVALAGDASGTTSRWHSATIAGRIALARGQHAEARRHFHSAIDVIEMLRAAVVGGAQDRARYFENKVEPFTGLASIELAEGRFPEALAAIERARARALVELISAAGPAVTPGADQTRARDLDRAIVTANAKLNAEQSAAQPNAARIAARRADLNAARLARDAYQTTLYAANPDLHLAAGDLPPVVPEQVARALGPGAALIEYVVTRTTTWAVVVASGARGEPVITARDLGKTAVELGAAVTTLRKQLATRDLGFRATASRLYRDVLAPVEKSLAGKTRIVIAPDGPLWQLPFQALVGANGKYVIEEHAVAYTPSVAVWQLLSERARSRARTRNRGAMLTAFGDPSGAPAAGNQPGLPHAAREVQTVGALYGAASGRVYEGKDATETRFRTEAPSASIVHVATHGVLDNQNPMYSYVALGGTGTREDVDGRIEARELRNLTLRADLAILSACETALGRVHAGEGVVGLSWSLFAAGASAVAVSLWKVDSESTADLMIEFHEQLRGRHMKGGGLQAAESLRRAALDVMRDERFRHPFYWAGFLVMGAAW